MTVKKILSCFLLPMCQLVSAQQDSIALDEVIVTDRQLREFSASQSVLKLNDSVIRNNRPSLTSLLNYNSPIYFKENGPGMVSSPSFRGTTAQQTAVIWNGLNINSQFNGQADFNTVTAKDFNSVSVRSGGGSVIYGSSAIGGSIHLNNELTFGKCFDNELSADYGSFNTVGTNYNVLAASDAVLMQISVSHNASDNDFDYPQPGRKNENGQYRNASINAGFGYKINANNTLKLYGYAFDGERHFSLISPTDTKTKYRDLNARSLLEWVTVSGALVSKIKAAFLTERYDYYGSLDNPASNYGKAQTVVARYDGFYSINGKMAVNAIADWTQTKGSGSDIGHNTRQVAALSVLFKHRIKEKFGYEIGLRREATNSYDSPLLFSAGADYRISRHYLIKINGSKNFRNPTFNDLYWLDGGNPDLRPESSLQAEIGNVFNYRNWQLSVTGYCIGIKDMIQWQPGTTASWHPVNVNEVRTYGLENTLGWHTKFGAHELALNGTYAYTVSENKKTGYQLIYVPYHKATGGISYAWKRFTADCQVLFTGEVFTRSDNNLRYNIDAYSVSNLGAGYAIGKQHVVAIGARVLNLFDEKYQVVAGRPFPGTNYNLFLNLKF